MTTARNAEIRELYKNGTKVTTIAELYKLTPSRIWQILNNNVPPKEPSDRTDYIGIHVTPETKLALQNDANAQGISMSAAAAQSLHTAHCKPQPAWKSDQDWDRVLRALRSIAEGDYEEHGELGQAAHSLYLQGKL